MALKTVFNNILVQIIEDESQIIISEDVSRPQKGVVVAIGSGTKDEPMQVREAMNIYFDKRDATQLDVDGETYYVLSQKAILAIEED